MGGRTRSLLVAIALAALAACTGAAPDPSPTPSPSASSEPTIVPTSPSTSPAPSPSASGASVGGTLRYGIGEPSAIVPADAVGTDDLVVVDALFDSLTTFDSGLSVIPSAAVSWEADESQRTWTFHLRPGARFHPLPAAPDEPGPPVTAADFKFAWEQAVTGGAGFRLEMVEGYQDVASGAAADLSGVEAVDDLTLRVRLRWPLSTFDAVVAHPSLAPVPREVWEADEAAFRRQPVGNGPFRAAEAWVRGQFLRVQRAPDWRNGTRPVELDEVLFTITDPDTAYVAFQQGRLQVSPLPIDAVSDAIAEYGESPDGYRGPGVLMGETPTLYFLAFNVTQPPYDDPEVRRAVSLAIDREAIVEEVGANVAVADSLLAPSLPNGTQGSCDACVHDPRTARRIFTEKGVSRLRLSFNRDGGHFPIARAIRDDLAAVGVVLELAARARDLRSYLDELADGDVGMFRFGWVPEHPVLDELLHPLFHSQEIGRRNYMRYSNPEVDELIDKARSSGSALRRVFLSRRAEDIILNRDQVIVPIMRYRHAQVVDERVIGYRLDPMGRPNLAEVSLSQ